MEYLVDLKKYKKIQDLYYNPRFRVNNIICKVCGKKLESFHKNHLKKCGISKEEYIEQYGFPSIFYEKDYLMNAVIDKLFDLYISTEEKWLLLKGTTREYITKEAGKSGCKKFKKYMLRTHLVGKDTIGVFPNEEGTKFMVMDIDTYGNLETGREIVRAIRKYLSYYFPKNQIHCSFSGNKGFHVTLYFNTFISIKYINKMFNIILNEIGINGYSDVNVELRPEIKGINGRGIKIPCGVNFLNHNDYANYCAFLNEEFEPVQYEIDYILNVEKSDYAIIDKVITDYDDYDLIDYKDAYIACDNATKKHGQEKCLSISDASKNQGFSGKLRSYLENGLDTKGIRHNISFKLALLLKEEGVSADECFDILLAWSIKQVKRGYSQSSSFEIGRDLKQIIYKDVYNSGKKYYFKDYTVKDAAFTRDDLIHFEKLNEISSNTGKSMLNHQKILFALMVHAKRYSDYGSEFFMTYSQITDLCGIVNSKTIATIITDLEKLGFLSIVSRNKYSNSPSLYIWKEANHYKLNIEHTSACYTNTFKICNKQKLCDNCFYCMISSFYNKKEINRVFVRSARYKIMKYELSCEHNNTFKGNSIERISST